MQATKLITKHYKVVSAATVITNFPAQSTRLSPQVATRASLLIQNTGLNPGFIHFGENVQGDGSDITLAAGAVLQYENKETCPREAINIGSVLGTTWAVVEGVEQSNG